MTSTAEWKELESKYYMFLVRRQPMVLEKGDCLLYTSDAADE